MPNMVQDQTEMALRREDSTGASASSVVRSTTMTKAREIAEEAVFLLRRKNITLQDIKDAVQTLEAMINAALAGDEQSSPNPEPPEPEPPTIWPE